MNLCSNLYEPDSLLDYEQSLLILGPSSKTCEIRKWPRACLKVPSFLAARRSRSPALPSLNLKKNRDCSQSNRLRASSPFGSLPRRRSSGFVTRSWPTNVCWFERKKNVDQSQQSSRSGECALDLETVRAWLSSRKVQKGVMKGEDLTVLEQTTQLTH